MLWIGEQLGPLERACMRSVMSQGHRLTLWTYGLVGGVPDGVINANAADIIPETAIIRHRSGSLALFSDWFRFALLQSGAGMWLDADVYLLQPIERPSHGNVFGLDQQGQIASCILQLPLDSPIIAPIIALFEQPIAPDWLRPRDRIEASLRRMLTGRYDLGKMPWGVGGPLALTALARRYRLDHFAAAAPVFSPWGYHDANWIFDPAQRLESRIAPETRALHLYNFMIADRKQKPAAAGSFMARLQAEGK